MFLCRHLELAERSSVSDIDRHFVSRFLDFDPSDGSSLGMTGLIQQSPLKFLRFSFMHVIVLLQ